MNNLSLYVIAQEHRALADTLQDMDLPVEAITDTLAAESNLVEKSAAVAAVIRNLDAMAGIMEAEAGRMAERAKTVSKRAEQVKAYLHTCMELAGVTKLEYPQFTLAIQKNPASVDVFSEEQIPAEFMRQPEPPAPKPDKKAILAALKSGADVPGAKIHNSTRLAIK